MTDTWQMLGLACNALWDSLQSQTPHCDNIATVVDSLASSGIDAMHVTSTYLPLTYTYECMVHSTHLYMYVCMNTYVPPCPCVCVCVFVIEGAQHTYLYIGDFPFRLHPLPGELLSVLLQVEQGDTSHETKAHMQKMLCSSWQLRTVKLWSRTLHVFSVWCKWH